MEDEGMKITVLGMILIVSAALAAILLLRHFVRGAKPSKTTDEIGMH